jgi:hypothetical protein
MNLLSQGHLLLASGDATAARACCLEAQRLAQEIGNWSHHCWATMRLAGVDLAEERVDSATSLAGESLALYRREGLESISLLSEIRLMQGRCALATGQTGQAAAIFRQVLDLPRLAPPQRRAAQEALAATGEG